MNSNLRAAWLVRLLFLSVLLSCAHAAVSGEMMLRGRVVAVIDGDTITVLDSDRRQHRVRLHQIDAPEKSQDYGAASKRSLSDLVFRKDVTVRTVTTDRYHRLVGTVYLYGTDINLEQIKRGMAWVYRQYARDPAYLAAERTARTMRKGLWAKSNPVPPWEFRHEHGEHEASAVLRWLKRFW